jgi:hypothetical protein
MLRSVLSAVLLTVCLSHAQAADFSAWGKNCTITFPGYTGPGTLTNFPVLVKLSTAISGFNYADFQASGIDLRFSDSASNAIPYEIDTWNASGTSLVWVKVPALSSGTQIKAYWKNATAIAPTDAAQTWDANFSGVYHMDDSISLGGPVDDSTSNTRDGIQGNGYGGVETADSSVIGGAMKSTGEGGGVDSGKTITLPGTTMGMGSFTKHMWYKQDLATAWGGVFTTKGTTDLDPYSAGFGVGGGGVYHLGASTRNNSNVVEEATAIPGGWQHCVFVYDAVAGSGALYRNGNMITNVASGYEGPMETPTAVILFGWQAGGQWSANPSSIDEARTSLAARSADWIAAEFKTSGDNANFTTYAAVQTVANPGDLISEGATWFYHNTGALPAADWTATNFVDAGWSNGAAPLGYPTNKPGVTFATELSFGGDGLNKWAAYYFRKHFTVADIGAVTGLVASFKVDDGAVIYLNGIRVRTTANIIEPVGNNTWTTSAATENPYVAEVFTINPNMLVTGDNVLAVEVHQNLPGSTDVYFDLSLAKTATATTNEVGGGYTPPVSSNLIAHSATWLYHNTGALPAADWYAAAYSDGSWSNGAAPLGYPVEIPVTTLLSFGGDVNNKWPAYYFRKHFTVTNTAAVVGLLASYRVDDGLALYLNGTRVHMSANIQQDRLNNSGHTLNASTSATNAITLDPSLLVTGDNVLAVEVHQVSASSTDVYFDLALDQVGYATTNQPGGYPLNWTTYNDAMWVADDTNGFTGSEHFTTNNPFAPTNGFLINSADGLSLNPVAVSIATNGPSLVPMLVGLTASNIWPAGTDAANEFEGKIGRGYATEIGTTDSVVTVTLSGLQTAKQYKLVVWASRVGFSAGYDNRLTDVTLLGADSFTNTSTLADGVTRTTVGMPQDMTTVRASFTSIAAGALTNYAPVARYELVRPGVDGLIHFTVTKNAASAGNAYFNAFKLVESEPVTGGGSDANGNGMDDAWEIQYFGGTNAVRGGTLEDYDDDGSMNYDEYRAGTNPTNNTSKLEMQGIVAAPANGGLVLSWASQSNKTYAIQNVSNLVGTWNTHLSGVSAKYPVNVYTTPVTTVRQFWRVKLE